MIGEMWTLLNERSSFFLGLLWEHLRISALAIFIAILLGGFLGILIGEYRKTSKLTLGAVNFIYTIPSISLLGFLIPFSGIGNVTAVIALTVYALLPMVRSTYTGMTNIDPGILEAAKGMGSTPLQILLRIKLPLAMPVIMSGIRSMVTMTIALAGIASFIGAGGLGVAIYRGITTNNPAMTMVGSLLIALLAIAADLVLGFLEKRIGRHGAGKRGTAQQGAHGHREGKRSRKPLAIALAAVLCISIAGAALWNTSRTETLHIATKPMTEQYVIGEMLKLLIEQDTNLSVELTSGVGGGTSNIEPAMESGEFDLYPEYTGTGWNMVLKETSLYDESRFEELQEKYNKTLDFSWVGMYGFNNTYGLVVRREIAEQYGLKTYSDLAKVSDQLIFGAEYDFFEREDGYEPLCEAYDFQFKSTMDLDIGLKYQAINSGKIDVMNIFTTDGQLSVSDVVVLVDDRNFYPSYRCGNVIRNQVLAEHPELADIFQRLEGTITDQAMADMNYQVETEGKDPREVAESFLAEAGLLR